MIAGQNRATIQVSLKLRAADFVVEGMLPFPFNDFLNLPVKIFL